MGCDTTASESHWLAYSDYYLDSLLRFSRCVVHLEPSEFSTNECRLYVSIVLMYLILDGSRHNLGH